jgi:16S rRNA processing protein RimM
VETVEVVVGRVGRPHGLRGEVSVELRTDEPERRFVRGATLRAAAPPDATGGDLTLTVAETRPHQGGLLVRFAELRDRTAAEAARGLVLHVCVPVGETPEDPEEYYDHQLVGLAAHDQAGAVLGEVSAVLHGSAQDLLEIRTPSGRLALVPFVAALVPVVDLAGGRVVVADRPGLLAPDPEADG